MDLINRHGQKCINSNHSIQHFIDLNTTFYKSHIIKKFHQTNDAWRSLLQPFQLYVHLLMHIVIPSSALSPYLQLLGGAIMKGYHDVLVIFNEQSFVETHCVVRSKGLGKIKNQLMWLQGGTQILECQCHLCLIIFLISMFNWLSLIFIRHWAQVNDTFLQFIKLLFNFKIVATSVGFNGRIAIT